MDRALRSRRDGSPVLVQEKLKTDGREQDDVVVVAFDDSTKEGRGNEVLLCQILPLRLITADPPTESRLRDGNCNESQVFESEMGSSYGGM